MLTFAPEYKERPWGSDRFASVFSRQVPDGLLGEAWQLGELDEFHAQVADGPLAGQYLGDLWRAGKLGGSAAGSFPFLLKWLDTAMPLSVQVHPSANTCRADTSDRSKTEAWYVAHKEEGSCLWAGLKTQTSPEEIVAACENSKIAELLCQLSPEAGELIFIPAGTVHALGSGFLILEVQEPSDTTFRLYDWGRLGLDGKPRALHLDAGTQAIDYQRIGPPQQSGQDLGCPAFRMGKVSTEKTYHPEMLRVFSCAENELVLTNGENRFTLQKGDIRVAEVSDGPLTLASGSGVLITEGRTFTEER